MALVFTRGTVRSSSSNMQLIYLILSDSPFSFAGAGTLPRPYDTRYALVTEKMTMTMATKARISGTVALCFLPSVSAFEYPGIVSIWRDKLVRSHVSKSN